MELLYMYANHNPNLDQTLLHYYVKQYLHCLCLTAYLREITLPSLGGT